ncbi:MAG: TatD family hydrolase [bacterium]
MRLVDSHSHLQSVQFDLDRDDVVNRALDLDMGTIIVGTDFPSSRQAVEMAEQYPLCWAAIGQHPADNKDEWHMDCYQELAHSDKVVAVGEIGLDYYRLEGSQFEIEQEKRRQQTLFIRQVELANELKLPVVAHCREAYDQLTDWLTKKVIQFPNGAVIHCFTGTVDQLEALVGFPDVYIGLTGIVTFAKAENVREAAKVVPLDRLLVETDSPFLSPEPHRGKRAEPSHVALVAVEIAKLREVEVETVEQATTENAVRLFQLTVPGSTVS